MSRIDQPDMLVDSTIGSLTAYASGDAVGGASSSSLQWTNAGGLLYLSDVVVTLETTTAADLVLALYNAAFTAGTDNAAFTEQAADAVKCVGLIGVPASKFVSVGGNVKRATIVDTPLTFRVEWTGGILYGQLLAAGALTLTATGITVKLGIYRG